MADSELGELRRPNRPVEYRIERLARWRAQGLAGGTSDSVFPADAVDDALASDGSGEGDGGDPPSWYCDTFNLTSATTSPLTLTYYPLFRSEVVRLNGVTLEPDVDYTIDGFELSLVDLADLRLGIGSDTWDLVASYAYVDAAEPTPDLWFLWDVYNDTSPDEALAGDEIGFLFVPGDSTAVSGYFETWELVDDGGTGAATDGPDATIDVWRGTGAAVSGTISITAPASATRKGAILAVFRDFDTTATVERLSQIEYDVNDVPATVTASGAGADEGDFVFAAIRGKNNFLAACFPDEDETLYTDTGFATEDRLMSGSGGTYGNGIAVSCGIASSTSVSTDFPMGGTDGYVQVSTYLLAVT